DARQVVRVLVPLVDGPGQFRAAAAQHGRGAGVAEHLAEDRAPRPGPHDGRLHVGRIYVSGPSADGSAPSSAGTGSASFDVMDFLLAAAGSKGTAGGVSCRIPASRPV